MTLKSTIVSILDRDDLKQIVDAYGIDDVDRRSAKAMRAALSRSRRVTLEELLGKLYKATLQQVCER